MLEIILATLGLLAMHAPPPPAAIAVPMQVVNNHGVVEATLDGAGPFHFIVDSGAGNLSDPAVAAALGARVGGHVGIGAATFVDAHFVVAAARSTFASAEGPTVDGLIGRAIIGSGVTVFDCAQRTLIFYAGVAGSCAIDTRSRRNVTPCAPKPGRCALKRCLNCAHCPKARPPRVSSLRSRTPANRPAPSIWNSEIIFDARG